MKHEQRITIQYESETDPSTVSLLLPTTYAMCPLTNFSPPHVFIRLQSQMQCLWWRYDMETVRSVLSA